MLTFTLYRNKRILTCQVGVGTGSLSNLSTTTSRRLRKWKLLLSALLLSQNSLVMPHHIKADMTSKAIFSFSRAPRSSDETADVSPQHGCRVVKGK